jgi:hypothetical protein
MRLRRPLAGAGNVGPYWFAALAVLVIMSTWLGYLTVRNVVMAWPKFPYDFLVFWTAARAPLHTLYDIDAITRAQAWAVLDLNDKRPFAYPPTFLFLIEPFGRLPILPAILAWSAMGIGLFCAAARRLIGHGWPLMIVSPAFVCAAVTGQATFLIGACLIAGVLLLPSRPITAGLLFGVVATLKPQVAVRAPLALAVGLHWRALLAAVVGGGLLGGISLSLHPALWRAWLDVLPAFAKIVENDPWDITIGVTPKAFAHQIGLQGTPGELALMGGGVALAVAVVIVAFRRQDAIGRYAALCVGYMLISPYALWYELALLQPVAVAMLLRRDWKSRVAGIIAYSLFAKLFSVVAVAAHLLTSRRPTGAAPLERRASGEVGPGPAPELASLVTASCFGTEAVSAVASVASHQRGVIPCRSLFPSFKTSPALPRPSTL